MAREKLKNALVAQVRAISSTSTLTPFLFLTPTILNSSSRSQHLSSTRPFTSSSRCRVARQSSSSGSSASQSRLPFEGTPEALGEESSPPKRSKTLTEEEKRAFQSLFSQIEHLRGDTSRGPKDPQARYNSRRAPENHRRESLGRQDEGTGTSRHPDGELKTMLGEVSFDRVQDDTEPRAVREEDVSHYPEPLRGMAMRAALARQRALNRASPSNEEKLSSPDEEEKELLRLSSEINDAQTDVDVWKTIEFLWRNMRSIRDDELNNSNLGAALKSTSAGKSKGRKKKSAQMLKQESEKPIFSNLMSAYSALILAAMRALTGRTVYSPLTMLVIPRMKKQGVNVYALGVSTALFNEQLSFQFRVLHDYLGMLATLAEMEADGVEPDERTIEILSDVSRYRYEARRGRYGEMAKASEELQGRTRDASKLLDRAEEYRERLHRLALERVERQRNESALEEAGYID